MQRRCRQLSVATDCQGEQNRQTRAAWTWLCQFSRKPDQLFLSPREISQCPGHLLLPRRGRGSPQEEPPLLPNLLWRAPSLGSTLGGCFSCLSPLGTGVASSVCSCYGHSCSVVLTLLRNLEPNLHAMISYASDVTHTSHPWGHSKHCDSHNEELLPRLSLTGSGSQIICGVLNS